MKKTTFFFITLINITLIGNNTLSAQEQPRTNIIKNFYTQMFAEDIKAEDLVKNLIRYADTLSFKNTVNALLDIRNPKNEISDNFILMKDDITNNKIKIYDYKSFTPKDKSKFIFLDPLRRKDVYKVIFKNAMPSFILLNDNKIESFIGFQKPGSEVYTFLVFE